MNKRYSGITFDGLTKEEEQKCWEAFCAFDKDKNGFIDTEELKSVLELMG